MVRHIHFPSIVQFRHVVESVQLRHQYTGRDGHGNPIYDQSKTNFPTLEFRGAVKLHGSNMAFVLWPDDTISLQTRGRIITVKDDYKSFAAWAAKVTHTRLRWLINSTVKPRLWENQRDKPIIMFGEWVGPGIQGGTAISKLNEKSFFLFAIGIDEYKEDGELTWANMADFDLLPRWKTRGIYNIFQYPTWRIHVDFKEPGVALQKLQELTSEVEKQCPVAGSFKKKGIGEGIVWRCLTPGFMEERFWFKIKGEKHSVTKTKEKIPLSPEKLASIAEFVEATVTKARLQQGISFLQEQGFGLDKSSTGHFLKWLANDILKEETDTIVASGLEKKEVTKAVSLSARDWFFKYLEAE